MAWGAAIAAAASIANQYMSNANSKRSYHYQSNLLNRQNAFAEKVMKNAHQWEKEDLLNAGINPLLTATGGSGASASGVTSAPSVQKADTPDMSKIVSNAIEAKNLKNNTKLTNAQVGKLSAEEENVKADTVNKQLDSDYKRIENSSLPKQIKAKIENMYADSKLKSFLSSAKQADKLNAEVTELRRRENWIKKHPYQASWTRGIGEWTGAFGNIFSGSYSFNRKGR